MIGILLLSSVLACPGADSSAAHRIVHIPPSAPSPYYYGGISAPGGGLTVWTDFLISSGSVPVNFASALLTKKQISDDLKTNASSRLGDQTTIGLHLFSGARFGFDVDSSRWEMSISVQQMLVGGVSFSKHLFDLVFFGNGIFEDQTATFHPLSYSAFSYNQFGVGLGRSFDAGTRSRVSVTIEAAAIAGAGYSQTSTTRGKLYTAPDGEFIDLDAAFTARFSDTSKTKALAFNGRGGALSLSLSYVLPRFQIYLGIDDLGFVRWNEQTLALEMDTTMHFDGFDARTFFDSPENFFNNIEDSLRELAGLRSNVGSITTSLPTRTTLLVSYRVPSIPLYVTMGVSHTFIEAYQPLTFLKTTATSAKLKGNASLTFTYGGFGGFNVGLEATKSLGSRVSIVVGLPSVGGLVAPGSFNTTGGWIAAIVSL